MDDSKQNEEFLRSLSEMKENLSQLNSYGHELTTNNTNLAKNLELLKAVMETLASNLNATSKNISSQTD